jgi:predicted acyltransferase
MPFFLFIVGMAIPLSLKVSCDWENRVAKNA